MKYDPKPCSICGELFAPRRINQHICFKAACRREATRNRQNEYRKRARNGMCESRDGFRHRKIEGTKPKPDTIVAEGYAKRQMAETLEIVGRVKI